MDALTSHKYWYRVAAAAIVTVTACDVPGVELAQPDVATGPGSASGVYVTLEDTALAAALGWSTGVPGATVVLHRFIDPFQPDTLYTDSTGYVRLPDLLPGWYLAAGHRQLTPDETGPTGGVIRAFGDGLKFTPTGRDSVELRLRNEQAGSLVFSEAFEGGGTLEVQYIWATFFELYNNSDTTIYVDQMILGRAYSYISSGPGSSCSARRTYRNDPLGIWSRAFHQFPGNGTDYPVAPGQVITIALDAVDHSVVHPSLPDLSQADFELEGTADTDNPDVPNMPSPSPSVTRPHGVGLLVAAYFLTLPVDPSALATQLIDDFRYARFPSDGILDVYTSDWAAPGSQPPFVREYYCTWINREFDRLETLFYRPGIDNRISIHRRILRDRSAVPVLQDLNVSFTDWVLGVYSPGRIEY